MATRHLRIHGLVQGVGYRASLTREAARLGVNGWVRNRRDGSVEAALDGTDEKVATLIAWARRGPPAARVERIEVSLGEENYVSFTPLPTA